MLNVTKRSGFNGEPDWMISELRLNLMDGEVFASIPGNCGGETCGPSMFRSLAFVSEEYINGGFNFIKGLSSSCGIFERP